jgi:hypothetical protein
MKKVLVGLLMLLLASTSVWGAGTCTQDLTQMNLIQLLTFTCTADSADGSFPSTVTSLNYTDRLKGWYLYKVITNPGTTAPTDNWDFTITDGDGIDVLGGAGANRHTTTSQSIIPLLTSNNYAQPFLDTWTLAITGNSNNSANIVIKAVFVK